MTYIKANNGVPEQYGFADLRRDNPNVSFPRKMTDEQLAEYGIEKVEVSDAPTYNPAAQDITLNDPVKQGNKWVQTYSVTDKPPSELANIVAVGTDALLDGGPLSVLADALLDVISNQANTGKTKAQLTAALREAVSSKLRAGKG